MALASANHQAQITSIQERARNHNERVLQIRQRRSSNERAQEERAQNEREQKHFSATERQVKKLSYIQEKAKKYNEKAKERVQALQAEE